MFDGRIVTVDMSVDSGQSMHDGQRGQLNCEVLRAPFRFRVARRAREIIPAVCTQMQLCTTGNP